MPCSGLEDEKLEDSRFTILKDKLYLIYSHSKLCNYKDRTRLNNNLICNYYYHDLDIKQIVKN